MVAMRTRTRARGSRILGLALAVTLGVTAAAQNPFQGFPVPAAPLDVPEPPALPNGTMLPSPQPLHELAPTPELRPFQAAAPTFTPLPLPSRPHFRWPARLALSEPLPAGATPDALLANVELLGINRGATPSVALRVGERVVVLRVGESLKGEPLTVAALRGSSVVISNGREAVELRLANSALADGRAR